MDIGMPPRPIAPTWASPSWRCFMGSPRSGENLGSGTCRPGSGARPEGRLLVSRLRAGPVRLDDVAGVLVGGPELLAGEREVPGPLLGHRSVGLALGGVPRDVVTLRVPHAASRPGG